MLAYAVRVRGYGQFCPVAQTAEVLAERWMPLVVRELVFGATRFNEIQRGVPLMSSSLLSKRLRELERAGVVVRRSRSDGPGDEYALTDAGRELAPLVRLMGDWGERWLRRRITAGDAEPAYVMWAVRGTVRREEMPAERTVIHFRYPRAPEGKRYWWLVLDRPEVDLCLSDPGLGIDLTVHSTPEAMASVLSGDAGLAAALRSGRIRLEGPQHQVRAFPRWFGISPFARAR